MSYTELKPRSHFEGNYEILYLSHLYFLYVLVILSSSTEVEFT